MGKMLDACTPRKGRDDKTFWLRVGRAYVNDKGLTMVYLDSYPLMDPEKGTAVIALFEQREKSDAKKSTIKDDDEIPF